MFFTFQKRIKTIATKNTSVNEITKKKFFTFQKFQPERTKLFKLLNIIRHSEKFFADKTVMGKCKKKSFWKIMIFFSKFSNLLQKFFDILKQYPI